MKEDRRKALFESIAQRDVPAGEDLWLRIAERIERRNVMQMIRTRPVLAVFLTLLALVLLSSVAYAIGKVAGFIPGVGVVDQSTPLRILAEPVITEKDGLTVTVSEVVADSERTFVAYTVDGIIVPKQARPICGALPSLQLPDGSTLGILSIGDDGPRGARAGSILKLEATVTYSSIPADVDHVTLTFPCILPEGTGPENWQIPLELSPAPKDYATPAVEIGATFVASNPTFAVTPTSTFDQVFTPEPCSLAFPNGSGLYLAKAIELPDSYILVGNFTDAGDLPGGLEVSGDPYDNLPEIRDAQGNSVAFKVRDDIQPEINDCYWARHWAYEIAKPVQGPLTMTLDQINIGVSETAQFSFEAGSKPQPGQVWQVDLPIHLGKYDYVIDSVEMVEKGYLFKYHSGLDVLPGTSSFLNIVGSSPEHDDSSKVEGPKTIEYSQKFTYPGPPPTGQLTVELSLYQSVPLQGPWTLTWTPPSQ